MTHASVATAHFAEGDFRVGSVIRRSASLLSRHFVTFSIVAVIACLPTLLLTMLARTQITTQPADPAEALNALAWAVFDLVSPLVLSTLGEAIIAHAAFQDMRSRPVRPTESLTVALRRFWPIVGLAIVANVLMWLGLILLIIPGLMLCTIWFVGVQACVFERLGPWASLRRSQELTEGHRWKVFWLALLLIITSNGSFLIEYGLDAVADPIVILIGKLIWDGLWLAFTAVVGTVTYHDLRVIKEGIDVEQIAAVFD
jgi:hypothetical protein